ncbi:hypothetical protein [Sphingomonas sp. M1A8_2b]
MRQWLLALLQTVFATLIILAPAAINRSPFIFYDTTHYLELGQSIFAAAHIPLKGFQSKDSASIMGHDDPAPLPASPAKSVAKTPDRNMSLSYVGGRSPYYSTVLALIISLGGLWLVAIVQALIGAWLCRTVVWSLPGPSFGAYAGLVTALTCGSSLPYFAAFTMPDIFAAYALVAMCLLAVRSGGNLVTLSALWAIAAFGILAHATILPLSIIAGVGIVVVLRLLRSSWRQAMGGARWPLSAVAIGALGMPVFAWTTQLVLHDAPRSPPYLMARILADGPGRRYLADHCNGPADFAICKYRDRPNIDHNAILWSTDPRDGVFYFADFDTRVLMSEQQLKFVLASIAYSPGLAFDAALANSWRQLSTLSIGPEIGATKLSWDTMVSKTIPYARRSITASRSYTGNYSFALVDLVIGVVFMLSLAFVIWRLAQSDVIAAWRAPKTHRVVLILAGAAIGLTIIIVSNAILCGTLSGPTNRYQGRLTWLLPAIAFLMFRHLGFRAMATESSKRRHV